MAGVSFSITDYQSGDPVDADINYLDGNWELDFGLSQTSSSGCCIIYNIPLDGAESRDVQVTPEKQGYDFFSWLERCRVYPYQASPEKVTIVPFEGAESGTGTGDGSGGGGGGGCLISTVKAN